MVENTKTWISSERNIVFLRNKKIVNLCFRWHILRSYRFVAEVTFNVIIIKRLQSYTEVSIRIVIEKELKLKSFVIDFHE